MARLFNGSDERLERSSSPVSAFPFTLSAWIYPTSLVNGAVIQVAAGGSDPAFAYILIRSDGDVNATARDDSSTTGGSALGASSVSTNTWHHLAGVFAGPSSRTVYLDGVAGTEDTTTLGTLTLDTSYIGAGNFSATSIIQHFPGRLAEAGIFDSALTADEIGALVAGYPPHRVRSAVDYTPIVGGDPEPSVMGEGAWTVTGSPSVADHPPQVGRWVRRRGIIVPPAAGGDTGSVTEGASAGDAFGAVVTAAASFAEGASAGDTESGTASAAGAIEAGALAGDDFVGTAAAGASITEGAEAGDTPDGVAAAAALITEGVLAGDSWVAAATALATFVEGAVASDDEAALAAAAATILEGAEAGDTFSTASAETGAIEEGALAGESWDAIVAALASVVEGAEAGDTLAATAAASASWAAGAVAGDSWVATVAASAAFSEGAIAGDTFAGAEAAVGRILSATLTLLTTHSRTRTVRPQGSATRTVKTEDSTTT